MATSKSNHAGANKRNGKAGVSASASRMYAPEALTPPPLPGAVPAPDQPRYFHRDLSWLEFNRRVLAQAGDEDVPLLERVRFLAIFTSNLDEFFMKRVGLIQRRSSRISRWLRPTAEHPASNWPISA